MNENPADPRLKNALLKFKEKYGESMPAWSAESYDGISFLGKIAGEGMTSSEGIKEALTESKDFPELAGNITLGDDRVIAKEYYLFTVRNGKFVRY